MSYESLEHVVRSRLRMFLRHTWLVTILGTLLLGAAVWAAIHFTMATNHIRIAAGPLDARFVHALSNQLATAHPAICICRSFRPRARKLPPRR